jgi:hypothetical protein
LGPADDVVEPRARLDDARAEPPRSVPIARVVLKSSALERPTSRPSGDEGQSVVERLLNEALSECPPSMRGECVAHAQRIEELEASVKAKEGRVAVLEALLAQEDDADVLRDELENTRAHSTRLEECVDRLTKERDRLQALAEEVQTLRTSVDFAAREAAELEEALRKERGENQRLANEVARLQQSLEASKKLA